MSRLSVIVSCLVALMGASSVLGHTTTAPASSSLSVVDRLKLLDPEDLDSFIKVHLALGLNCRASEIEYVHEDAVIKLPQELNISEDKYTEIQAIEVPQQFSENLLDYTRSEYKLDYDDVHTLVLNSQVCFPGEVCLEVGDIGGSCCPF